MGGKISIDRLKEHPKNGYYFSEIDGEKYEEIKRSIATHGIRDPLKVTTSYTVISGHQRLRIAKELGFKDVPVEILDVDEWQAEYLLIAENVERRGQAETDPIKKARIAQFLKEYWGVNQGTRKGLGQNGLTDVAEIIGETERTTKRLIKLNDLIPELQALVSAGKLGTTAAEQLAYLTEEEQRALVDVIGEKVSEASVQQAKEWRKQAKEAAQKGEDFSEKIRQAEMKARMAEQKAQKIEKSFRELTAELEDKETRLKMIEEEKRLLERKLKAQEKDIEAVKKIKDDIQRLARERDDIYRQIESATELSKLYVEIENFLKTKLAPIKYSRSLTERQDSRVVVNNLLGIIEMVESWCREMRSYLPDNKNYIDAEVIDV